MNEMLETRVHPKNPRARIRVLVGMDDGRPFEVRVPMRVKDVETALDWLRPKDVPPGTTRQGEFFFVPVQNPHNEFCDHGYDGPRIHGYELYKGQSCYRYSVAPSFFSFTHVADECIVVVKSGETAFYSRRKGSVQAHSWTGRPRYFVRGVVRHTRGDHPDLNLGDSWHEVIPNKAHGPFPMRGASDYAD